MLTTDTIFFDENERATKLSLIKRIKFIIFRMKNYRRIVIWIRKEK